jgi:hypothetical protein
MPQENTNTIESKSTQGTKTNDKTQTITLSLTGNNISIDHFMNFANALANAVKYARDENLEDFRMKKKLLETLVPTSKSTAKTALLFGKISSGQIKSIRENAGYTNEGEFLKSTSYKG